MKLLKFPANQAIPNLAVIAMVDDLLERAKDGTLQTLFVVGLDADGYSMSAWNDTDLNPHTLIGAIVCALREYQEGMK